MLVRETKQNESFSWFSVKNNETVCPLKVSKIQNEFIKSSFLPKYEPKIVRISALYTTGQKSLKFLVQILGEKKTHSEIY